MRIFDACPAGRC